MDEVEHENCTPFDFEAFRNSMRPAAKRNSDRRMKVYSAELWLNRHIPWMGWPILKFVYQFWYSMMDEGIVSTCKARWGMVTFAYLNDGAGATVWHTWRQLTRNGNDKYTGIYPEGAPKSLAHAESMEAKWEAEREAKRWSEYRET